LLECKLLESILAKTQFNKTLARCCLSITENEAKNSLIFSQLKTKQNSSSNRSNKNNASNTLFYWLKSSPPKFIWNSHDLVGPYEF
jgi:hypothetical protein